MATSPTDEKNGGASHIEKSRQLSVQYEHAPGYDNIADDAKIAADDEHNMTFLQAVRRYPKACFWTAVVTMCIIMDGYDSALIGSLFGFPGFQTRFGIPVGNTGTYTIAAQWQLALNLGTSAGNCVGVALNGLLSDRFGHKKVLLATLACLTGFIFIQFFAPTVEILCVGQILCGVAWGVFSTMAPAYASEVGPLALRPYFEIWVVSCWGIGQFFAYAVLFNLNTNPTVWGYRIAYAVQWVWPVIIFPLVCFCPESPWWLVRQGRIEEAQKSVMRLSSAKTNEEAQEQAKMTIALMIETNSLEKDIGAGTSYFDCFRGSNLWRTEVTVGSWVLQVISGFVIQGYAIVFFEQAGLSPTNAFKMTLGQGGIHLLANLASAPLTAHFGRRILYLIGLGCMTAVMYLIGFLALADQTSSFGYAESSLYLLWFTGYCLTIGPLAYIMVGEASSTRMRFKTIAVGRFTYNVVGIINSIVSPYILNPTQGNWKGKAGFLTGGLSTLGLVWIFFRLPETKNRTFEELDILFAEKNMTARNFDKAVVTIEGGLVTVTGPHVKHE